MTYVPSTLNPKPYTLNSKPATQNPKPCINLKNLKDPYNFFSRKLFGKKNLGLTLHPKPQTLNPKL